MSHFQQHVTVTAVLFVHIRLDITCQQTLLARDYFEGGKIGAKYIDDY
jgi:hypothetical protein